MRIVIRVDASPRIGGGHALRCLALAQAARDRGATVAFAMADGAAMMAPRLAGEAIELVGVSGPPGGAADAREVVDLARTRTADWLVLDGYAFDPGYARAAREGARFLLRIDDPGELAGDPCDLLVNPNVGIGPERYPTIAARRLMLGPDYALLRRRARAAAATAQPPTPALRRVVLTFGASDPADATRRLVDLLLGIDGLRTDVIVGPAYAHVEALRARIGDDPRLVLHVDVAEPAELIAAADVVVCNGGGTLWEVAAVGRPALLVTIAGNQAGNVAWFHARGLAQDLGPAQALTAAALAEAIASLSYARRCAIAAAGRRLVDGSGPMRVLDAMAAVATAGSA